VSHSISESLCEDVGVCAAVAAVEFADLFDIEAARAWFIEQGTFIRPLGRTMHLTPAYGISESELLVLTGAIAAFAQTRNGQ